MSENLADLGLKHANMAAVDPSVPEGLPVLESQNGAGECLHSLSWLFVLIGQIWNLIVPLTLVFVAGRIDKDDGWESLFALIAALVLSAYSLFYTLTFRYWVTASELIVKEGVFNRTLRHVPFTRIQNIAFRQSLLHRLFGVVELNLESGAGTKPEAKLTVLTIARARVLEREIRGSSQLNGQLGHAQAGTMPSTEHGLPITSAPTDAGTNTKLLHQVPLLDLIRLGLISNRGMVAIGAAFYFLSQTKLLPTNLFKAMARWLKTDVGIAHGPAFWLLSGIITLAILLIVVRIASIGMAIFSFYGFKLYAEADRLRVEHGLFTRQGGATKPSRIVCLLLRDGLLYRWFNRQSVEVVLPGNVAQDGSNNGPKGMRYLSPMAAPADANALIALASGVSLLEIQLQPLHPRAWRRMAKWPLVIAAMQLFVLIVFLTLNHQWLHSLMKRLTAADFVGIGNTWAPIVLVGLMFTLAYGAFAFWMVYALKRSAAASGFALTPRHLVIRSGYFSQCSHIVPRSEIQSVTLRQSPFDRRSQMATIHVDLRAGSIMETPEPALHYLPETIARSLVAALRTGVLAELPR